MAKLWECRMGGKFVAVVHTVQGALYDGPDIEAIKDALLPQQRGTVKETWFDYYSPTFASISRRTSRGDRLPSIYCKAFEA